MNSKRFTKPPLSSEEIEKRAEEFVNMTQAPEERNTSKTTPEKNHKAQQKIPKDPMVPYALRLPKRVHENLREIANITNLSFNSVCIEMLRSSAKKRLQELKE